ncbi:hypothetical protein ACFU5Y_04355 [Streptomyces gardneri]|uniref:hypothetical protein n=1 Tax=Streptomyces gardneri TaxID=66892 RepID=UPI00367913B7
MRTRSATALIAALLAALTACGGSDNPPTTPAAKPDAEASTASPSAKTYSFQDCVALLKYDYQQGQPQDASKEPECAHLTSDEYTKAVGEVLATHKDEFIQQGAREVVWDKAWDGLTAGKQKSVCDEIEQQGVDAVAEQLKSAGAEPKGHETEMVEYYRDKKC